MMLTVCCYGLERKGLIKDEVDRFEENPICRECGSENVTSF